MLAFPRNRAVPDRTMRPRLYDIPGRRDTARYREL